MLKPRIQATLLIFMLICALTTLIHVDRVHLHRGRTQRAGFCGNVRVTAASCVVCSSDSNILLGPRAFEVAELHLVREASNPPAS